MRVKVQPRTIDRRKLAELWQAGVPAEMIARKLGCAVSSVHNTAASEGLPPRRFTKRSPRKIAEQRTGADWLEQAQAELFPGRGYFSLEPHEWLAVVDRAAALLRQHRSSSA